MTDLPDLDLMLCYGNEDILQEKLASGKAELAKTILGLVGGYKSQKAISREIEGQRLQAELMNEAFRELEHMQMAQANSALRYTPIPWHFPQMGLYPGSVQVSPDLVPSPMAPSEGMVRIASIMEDTGRDMAKTALNLPGLVASGANFLSQAPGKLMGAGKQLFGGMTKGKVLGAGAVGLGLYGAYKGMKAGLGYMSREAQPANYNPGGVQIAHGVNAYGNPQLGTPFTG